MTDCRNESNFIRKGDAESAPGAFEGSFAAGAGAAELVRAQLCVVGGGMAGICAAVSAARRGVSVVLVQDRPVLGGNASGEVRMWIRGASIHFPYYREGGIIEEIAMRNLRYNPSMSYGIWDGVLYDLIVSEPNIRLLLNTTCLGGEMRGQAIAAIHAWQLTTYRRFRIEADFFADCSGDSILAEFSGAKLMRGREARAAFGESCAPERADLCTMGSSCLIQARETERPVRFTPPAFARRLTEEDFYRRLDVNDPRSFIQDNFWWIEIGGERDTLRDAEQIKHELLSTAYGVWDFIKNSGRFDSENWELDWVGFLSGKRESRRYAGDYVLSQRDLEAAGPFWDEVAYGGWSMDDHNPLGINTREAPNRNLYLHAPYAIPYRCLYSANVPNLFFAGRNVSVTHMALSSTRVMATCALMGQAVGNACALALARGADARGVCRWMAELQQWLRNDDCFLPHVPRKASSALEGAAHNLPEDDFHRLLSGIERKLDTEEACVRLPVGQTLELRFAPVCCGGIRLVFDNDIARESCRDPGLRMYPQKLNVTRSDSPAQIPPNLVKAYEVHVLRGGRWEMLRRETENYLRLVRIPVSGEIEGIRFVGRETYGAPEIRLLSLDVEE